MDSFSKTACNQHAAGTTKDFWEIISTEDESEKERQDKITKVFQNHQFAKAA